MTVVEVGCLCQQMMMMMRLILLEMNFPHAFLHSSCKIDLVGWGLFEKLGQCSHFESPL